MALKITPGNTADSTMLDERTKHLTGKLYADKGYIGHDLFNKLWQRGLHLITRIRRNMKSYLMALADKIMLRKRFVIETVLDTLKSEMGGAKALGQGDVELLGRDIIHSVTNPIAKLTGAIHVYGGDFFATERSEWEPETLTEQRCDPEQAMLRFDEANRSTARHMNR